MGRKPLDQSTIDERAKFGARLRSLRDRKKLTQQIVADRVGIKRQMLSDIEKGERDVPASKMEFYAAAYDLTVEEFVLLRAGSDSLHQSVDRIYSDRRARQERAEAAVIVHFEPHEAYHAAGKKLGRGGRELESQTAKDLLDHKATISYSFCMPKEIVPLFWKGLYSGVDSELRRQRRNTSADACVRDWCNPYKGSRLSVFAIDTVQYFCPLVVYDPEIIDRREGYVWFAPHEPNRIAKVSDAFLSHWANNFFARLRRPGFAILQAPPPITTPNYRTSKATRRDT